MNGKYFSWVLRRPKRWNHLQHASMRQLSVFLSAAFFLFSVIGLYSDLMAGGVEPYAIVLTDAIYGGLCAVAAVLVVARLPTYALLAFICIALLLPSPNHYLTLWIESEFHPARAPAEAGLHFAATATLTAVMASYVCFARYISMTGKETLRIKTELELAHSIQKTLVPPIHRLTGSFEIYGVSHPSDKVGGDLVDAVELAGGDTVAYLADIAGHGLQAGILMGMLKTSARTALAAGDGPAEAAVLSQLMQTLNCVLPQVKEAHMYATFAALRLDGDGRAFYGMAASTPLVHWSAASGKLRRIEEEQFPLGLLPVAAFPAWPLAIDPGDLLAIATDGILEVTAGKPEARAAGFGSEFGVEIGAEFAIEALESLLAAHARLPLPQLAEAILDAVRRFGNQVDDQTLLLVRRRAIE